MVWIKYRYYIRVISIHAIVTMFLDFAIEMLRNCISNWIWIIDSCKHFNLATKFNFDGKLSSIPASTQFVMWAFFFFRLMKKKILIE